MGRWRPPGGGGGAEVGQAGAEKTLEIDLWPKEVQALKASAAVLQKTLGDVLASV